MRTIRELALLGLVLVSGLVFGQSAKGKHPMRSTWVTVGTLMRPVNYGQKDVAMQVMWNQWFWGTAAAPPPSAVPGILANSVAMVRRQKK